MAGPLGDRISSIFVDEFHDLYAGHPNCLQIWEDACCAIAEMPKPRAFMSATHPPHLHELFLRKAHINPRFPLCSIRAPTDQPKLAYYILSPAHFSIKERLWLSTIGLVGHLVKLLEPDEQILVFFEKREEVDAFLKDTGCAAYHSKLSTDMRAYNLDRWDSGNPPVMAATMAAGQGVDRPHVKFVLIHRHTFGMPSYAQQGGRGGRGGRPSYVILLRDPTISLRTQPESLRDVINCIGPFINYAVNKGVCRRKALLAVMDGELEGKSFTCLDKPGCNPCDVCDPNSDMLKVVSAAAFPLAAGEPTGHPSWAAISEPHVTATRPFPKVTPKQARVEREDGTMTLSQGSAGGSGHKGSPSSELAGTSIGLADRARGRHFEKVRASLRSSIYYIMSHLRSLTHY